jgi:hypothetical protein
MNAKYMTMKTLRLILILCGSFAISTVAYSQKTKEEEKAAKAAEVKSMVESKNFVFQAQSAMPTKLPTQQLSPGNTFKVLPEEARPTCLISPMYRAPINPSESGIKFTSTKFEYTVKETKKEAGKFR